MKDTNITEAMKKVVTGEKVMGEKDTVGFQPHLTS